MQTYTERHPSAAQRTLCFSGSHLTVPVGCGQASAQSFVYRPKSGYNSLVWTSCDTDNLPRASPYILDIVLMDQEAAVF